MNWLKIKEELKKTLGLLEAEPATELKVSEMVIGGKVESVNADGTLSEVADGEYKVGEDVIEVKAGQIVSINGEKEKEEEAPAEAEKEMEEEIPTEEAPATEGWKEALEAYKAELDGLKLEIETLKEALGASKEIEEKMSAEFSKQLGDLNETLKVIANTPAEFSKTNQSPLEKDAKERKLSAASSLWAKRN